MNYATVCSGIEAPSAAWDSLGWKPQWFSEIEAFPSAVLAHHYSHVPNLGDMTKLHESETFQHSAISLLCGGTPCQSFSVAGLRKGLDDPRGNLMLTFLALADRKSPRWLVWENVPGVLSSNSGRDFGAFLGALVQLGYGFAYRVLDAQYYGVAQRRRRVFVVAHLGSWQPAAAVLFERHSLSGHPAPSRESKQRVADTLTVGANQYSGFVGEPVEQYPSTGEIAHCLNAGGMGRQDFETETLIASTLTTRPYADNASKESQLVPLAFTSKDFGGDAMDNLSPTLRAGGHDHSHQNSGIPPAVAYNITFNDANGIRKDRPNGGAYINQTDVSATLTRAQSDTHLLQQMAVRRLTPIECERLQGFPDGYTDIRPKGKPTPDGPRYKALGNSMAVPVMRWIGQRIELVDEILTAP
jgi:DNA (cytosine-5)-methyltransferase 1